MRDTTQHNDPIGSGVRSGAMRTIVAIVTLAACGTERPAGPDANYAFKVDCHGYGLVDPITACSGHAEFLGVHLEWGPKNEMRIGSIKGVLMETTALDGGLMCCFAPC